MKNSALLLVVLAALCAVYGCSSNIYEAKSEVTMDIRRSLARGQDARSQAMPDYGVTYAEILNTRIPDWRSEKLVTKVVQHYRANHPASTIIPDEELISTIMGAKIELERNSRIITIAVRSKTKELCAALANAYAESIETFTDEENKARCDKAVAQIHANVEKKRREVDKLAKQLMDLRAAGQTTHDVLALEAELGVANRVLEGLILDENKARIEAESNNEIVRVGRPAREPSQPLSIFETSLSIFD